MIIKTFTAESSAAALKRVKAEMGGEAIVLKTRQVSDESSQTIFEVTACLEKPTVDQSSKSLSSGVPLRSEPTPAPRKQSVKIPPSDRTERRQEPTPLWQERLLEIDNKLDRLLTLGGDWTAEIKADPLEAIRRLLIDADLPAEFIDEFLNDMDENAGALDDLTALAREKMVAWLGEHTIPDLTLERGDRVVFVGPAGSGKSSVMGKLATGLVVKQKRKVCLITLDDIKLGALDEIHSYADILGVDVVEPDKASESAMKWRDAVTLIDSPAMPCNNEELDRLSEKINAVKPTHRLAVFSALVRSTDTTALSAYVKKLDPTHIVVTMQDLTESYGSAVAAIRALGVKLAFVTDRPGGTGVLKTPDPDMMARSLLNVEVAGE